MYPNSVTVSDKVSQCYLTPRYFLQLLGTECGRHCFPETWVNKALEIAKELLRPEHKTFQGSSVLYSPQRGLIHSDLTNTSEATGEWYKNELGDVRIPEPYVGYVGVIHPDARFKNEFGRVKEEGGTIIRVKRYVDEFPMSSIDSSHLSEKEIFELGDDKFDHVILNDGTIKDLHRKVREAILR